MKALFSRRRFLQSLCATGAVLATGAATAPGMRRQRPNIVILYTDDQRFDTIRALGNPHVITPNMDALVRRGVAFTNAYIMGGMRGAICIPSRAMLMTGRTLFHLDGDGVTISPEHVMLPERLRQAGYTTFQTGKWHNDTAAYARAFAAGDAIFFFGMGDHFRLPLMDFSPTGDYLDGPARNALRKQAAEGPPGQHSSERFSDAAIRFLRGHQGPAPFFLYLAYTAPHDPRDMPEEYRRLYDPAALPLPENFLPEHPFDNGDLETRDEQLAPWPRTPEVVRRHLADYYAMITHLDAQIGRVLAALDETGHADDTYIVFAGDNGLAVGRHGLMGKQNVYDHSVHVPLVLCGPGIPKGETRDALCYLLDVYPTLCDLLDLSTPESVEGRSLVPVIRRRRREVRDTLAFAYKDYQRSVRDRRYKLIEYAVNGRRTTQLFDLETDPWEMRNLAGDPHHARRLKRLREELLRWRDTSGDPSTTFWAAYDTGV